MNLLSVENLSKTKGEKLLFENISFGIQRGQKIALVGINGSGKSTLLKIIAGIESPDEGEVAINKEVSIAYLEQKPEYDPHISIADYIFSSSNKSLQLVKSYQLSLEKNRIDELQPLIEQIDGLGIWDIEQSVKEILGSLGIHDLNSSMSSLSGGQVKRVALAQTLVEKPDCLILDEPTNHLDISAIEWLESYLSRQNQSLLLVTHDRYFLDTVTNEIIELADASIHSYKGNYQFFLEKKAERLEQEQKVADKAKNLFKKELEWMRRQPKARGTKAKYRIDAFHELRQEASKSSDSQSIELGIQGRRQGGTVLEVENLSKRYDEKIILEGFSYIFKKQEKIGLIGKNGSGKSTLLNILTESITPDHGKLKKGYNTVFGYYKQEEREWPEDQRMIDWMKEIAEVIQLSDGSTISASQFLNRFLFPPGQQYQPIGKLSGGERRRLQLVRELVKNPNFLILDEPTNDLDLDTLNVLESFLLEFKGTLILVSHDRYFMDRLVDHLFVLEGNGKIKDFPGNYTDYKEWQKSQAPQKIITSSNKPIIKDKKEDKKKATYKEKREFESLEVEIDKLEGEKEELLGKLNEGGNHEKLLEWSEKLELIHAEIEKKTNRWLELAELMD